MNKFLRIFLCVIAIISYGSINSATAKVSDFKGKMKFTPGHYISIKEANDINNELWIGNSSVTGIKKGYAWKTLEPEMGKYDFSGIRSDLAICKADNKQFVLTLQDKTFTEGGTAMPDYLSHLIKENYTTGTTPMRWESEYVERLNALCNALAAEFDRHPNFEGIVFQESALSINLDTLYTYGYTLDKYVDAIESYIVNAAKAFKKSRVIWFANFLKKDAKNANMIHLCDTFCKYKVVLAGPDIVPYRTGLSKKGGIYDLHLSYYGKTFLGNSMQANSYRHHKNDLTIATDEEVHPEGYVSMEDMFFYARDYLKLNYIFWSYVFPKTDKIKHSGFPDALRVIGEYPTFNESFELE